MTPLDDIELEHTEEADVNPWLSIWLSPKQTIQWLVNNNAGLGIILVLIYLGGVHYGMSQAEYKALGDNRESSVLFLSVLFVSGIGGLVTYHLLMLAANFCATWFDGKGSFAQTRIAFAWAFVPTMASLFMKLLMYLYYGHELFTSNMVDGELVYSAYTILTIIFSLWHFILVIVLFSEVQKINLLQSFLSFMLGVFILVLPFVLIILVS